MPVRGVFETLGFTVDWNNNTRQATLTKSNDIIVITLDSATFTVNGANHTLDVPAQNVGGRTLVPLRAVLESVGYKMDWDGNTNTVVIGSEAIGANTEPVARTLEQIFSPEELALFDGWGGEGEMRLNFMAKLRENGKNIVFQTHPKTITSELFSVEFDHRVRDSFNARIYGIEVRHITDIYKDTVIPAAIYVQMHDDGGASIWLIEALEAEGLLTGSETYRYISGHDASGGLYLEIDVEGSPSLEQVLQFLENLSDEQIADLVERFE